jgi:hypothetical protein
MNASSENPSRVLRTAQSATLLLLLCCFGGTIQAQTVAKPPEPRMSALLESTALVPTESARIRVWVENTDSVPLTPAQLHWAGPNHLRLGLFVNDKCVTEDSLDVPIVSQSKPITLSPLQPKSVTTTDLCIRATSVVLEGAFTIGIVLLYGRSTELPTSYMLVEKTIEVGLFGNDAVAGVSLRLASFIIPGLLFFFMLQIGKLSPFANLDSLKLSTLSVVFSFLLTLLAAKIKPLSEARAVSLVRFAALCGVAVAIGLFVQAVKWIVDSRQQRRAARATEIQTKLEKEAAAAKVGPIDDEVTALRKAIDENPRVVGPIEMTLVDERVLIGSVWGTTSDNGKALFGWFELDGTAAPQLATLKKNGDYAELLREATRQGLRLTRLNGIRKRIGSKIEDVEAAPPILRFRSNEIRSTVQRTVSEISETGPIEVR